MNQKFDGIYTGFVASEAQIDHIFRFIDTFRTPDTFLLVDPVMGDDGITYDVFTPSLLAKMKELALNADIVTPNMTELCLLTDYPYEELIQITDTRQLLNQIQNLGHYLCNMGPSKVIVTGIPFTEDGIRKMGNLYITNSEHALVAFPYVGGSYSGTGDLFASCLVAGIARDLNIPTIIKTAGTFLEYALTDSVRENVPENDGVNYEKYLYVLMNIVKGENDE